MGNELWARRATVVDTAFVGRLPGDEALGGLAVATSVFTFTFLLFNFLSTVCLPCPSLPCPVVGWVRRVKKTE